MAEQSQWGLEMSRVLERLPPPQDREQRCIYRVPKILTDINRNAYTPKLVSIGPYHHNRRRLLPMEPHKHNAVIQFLLLIAEASKTPDDAFVAMMKVKPSLLLAYNTHLAEEGEDEDDLLYKAYQREWIKENDEFIELMIHDGCFVLEVMLAEKRSVTGEKDEYPTFGEERNNYAINDLKRDMLLIENQLPLLALSTLASIEGSGIGVTRFARRLLA